MNETQTDWKPTHESVHDGSPVMMLTDEPFDGLIAIQNEDGEVWIDKARDWTPIQPDFVEKIVPHVAQVARDFCRDTILPSEYVRGQAELLIDMTPGLGMDDKAALMEWLASS